MIEQTNIPLTVHLAGPDGNAFCILGNVQRLLKQAGYNKQEIDEVIKEAMSSDYNHLLETIGKVLDLTTI